MADTPYTDTRGDSDEAAGSALDAHALDGVFRKLVEQSLVGIALTQDGRFLYVNPRLAEMFDHPADHLLTELRVDDLVWPADRELVGENVRRRLAGEVESIRYMFRGRRRDGSAIILDAQGTRIEVNGRPALISTLLDVTERQRGVEQLRRREEHFRSLIENAWDIIQVVDEKDVVRYVSPSVTRVLGYRPQEVAGRKASELVHPDDVFPTRRSFEDAIGRSAVGPPLQLRTRHASGEWRVVEVRGKIVRGPDREALAILNYHDVTERSATEKAHQFLARARTLLDETLDHRAALPRLARMVVGERADYCIVELVDDSGALRQAAAAHRDPDRAGMLQGGRSRSLDEDPERSPSLHAIRSREPVLLSEFSDSLLSGLSAGAEHRSYLREYGPTSVLVAPLVAHGRALGAMTLASVESGRRYGQLDVMVAQDLAYRVALAVEHGRLFSHAQEAIRARDEILGIVSHDLRHPLNLVQLSAGMLLDAADERRTANVRPVEIIERAVSQMNRLIGDLLDLSSIEARRFAIERQEHDVRDLMSEADALLRPLAEEKGVHFRCEVHERLPHVNMDAHQVLRVICNVGSNAIKFAPESGTVTVHAAGYQDGVQFTVTDDGPGIPDDQLPHVFDRYWQGRRGDRRGAGLGLAIARGIVEAHGGRIWAEQGPDGGSIFYFTIPAGPCR